jgi:uncharacterized protein (DUF1800 family)
MTQREVQHLYLRAGFGASITVINESEGIPREALIDKLFADSARPTPIEVVRMPTQDEMQMAMNKDKTPEQKKMLREYARDEDKKLNIAWLTRMMRGEEMLNEKMTFFWHDHFACKDENPIHSQSLNNTVRKYALGDFREMLVAVSKEPAMLKFLNNQQNKKNAPNENFAREVMELFTLGRGNYTEQDVKNGAKAFTGWGFDHVEQSFEFRDKQHDYGEKTFLGHTGNLSGEDVLHIITEQRQCAVFITDKIYRYFVNENGNKDRVDALASSFYEGGYNIGALMRNIFSADWFYDRENIGVRIKSPIELVASLGRQFDPAFTNDNILLLVQRVLGQLLFNPPNVAGWPNGQEWIDSSSLIFRTTLGKKLIDGSAINALPKPDDDKTPNEMLKKDKRFDQIEAHIRWEQLAKEFPSAEDRDLIAVLSLYLLQTEMNQPLVADTDLKAMVTKEQKIKHICSVLTSLPEYQLC